MNEHEGHLWAAPDGGVAFGLVGSRGAREHAAASFAENRSSLGPGVANWGPRLLSAGMEESAKDAGIARRALRILYVCMAVGVVLPFVLYWLLS